MTLIASTVTEREAYQVTDRLVSRGAEEFDPTANKSLIFVGPVWNVVMSYTGTAYIADLPTDEWIAEKLLKKELPRMGPPAGPVVPWTQPFPVPYNSVPDYQIPETPSIEYGRQRTYLNLGAALFHLMDEIDRAFAAAMTQQQKELGLEIVVVGWEWKVARPKKRDARKRLKQSAQPVLFRLIKTKEAPCYRATSVPRTLDDDGYTDLAPDRNVEPDDVRLLKELLSQTDRSIDKILIELVRGISAKHPDAIGSDLMTVVIPHPRKRGILVNFDPSTSQKLRFTASKRRSHTLRGFSRPPASLRL